MDTKEVKRLVADLYAVIDQLKIETDKEEEAII
jgi:hypothetical protein